jgi:hypothetical protein
VTLSRFSRWLILRRAFKLADSGGFEDRLDIEAYMRIVESCAKASLVLNDAEIRARLDRRCLLSRAGDEAA